MVFVEQQIQMAETGMQLPHPQLLYPKDAKKLEAYHNQKYALPQAVSAAVGLSKAGLHVLDSQKYCPGGEGLQGVMGHGQVATRDALPSLRVWAPAAFAGSLLRGTSKVDASGGTSSGSSSEEEPSPDRGGKRQKRGGKEPKGIGLGAPGVRRTCHTCGLGWRQYKHNTRLPCPYSTWHSKVKGGQLPVGTAPFKNEDEPSA